MTYSHNSIDHLVVERTEGCLSDHGGPVCPVEHLEYGPIPGTRSVRAKALGAGAWAMRFCGTWHATRRTPGLISRSTVEYLGVMIHRGGTGVIDQHGRQQEIRPGHITFYDWSHPSDVLFPSAVQADLLLIEWGMVSPEVRQLTRRTVRTIPTVYGTSATLRSILTGLVPTLTTSPDAAVHRVGSCVVDLSTLLLKECLTQSAPVPPADRVLLDRVLAYVETRLSDPDLCPESVAIEHFISTRYLAKLFAAEGTTLMRWVRHRRLAKCRMDLLDPNLRNRSVASVGARWGLLQPAHFSRAFRAQYGVCPREYRRSHLTPAPANVVPPEFAGR